MAYIFPKTDELLQKNDIFNSEQGTPPEQQGQTSAPQGAIAKTTAEGSTVGMGSSSAPSQNQVATYSEPQSSKAVMQKNEINPSNMGFVNNIGKGIASQEKTLNDEAAKYTANANAQNFNISNSDLDKAITSGGSNATKVSGLLKGTAPTAEKWATTIKPETTGAENLKTKEGISNELAKQLNDSRYSAGERALDSSLLNRNKEFQKTRELVLGNQNKLEQEAANYAKTLPTQAQNTLNTKYANAQNATKTYLNQNLANLKAQNEQEAAAENAARQNINMLDVISPQVQEALSQYGNTFQYDPTTGQISSTWNAPMTGLIDNPDPRTWSFDPTQFYSAASPDVTAEQMVDANEANRFNNIYGMLGLGQLAQPGMPLGSRYDYNINALRDALANQYSTIDADRQAAAQQQAQFEALQNQVPPIAETPAPETTSQDAMNGPATVNPAGVEASTGGPESGDWITPIVKAEAKYDPVSNYVLKKWGVI